MTTWNGMMMMMGWQFGNFVLMRHCKDVKLGVKFESWGNMKGTSLEVQNEESAEEKNLRIPGSHVGGGHKPSRNFLKK